VLGKNAVGEAVTLGYNRDMPDIEGFGIQSFPIINDDNRKTMFFQLKPEVELEMVKTMAESLENSAPEKSRIKYK